MPKRCCAAEIAVASALLGAVCAAQAAAATDATEATDCAALLGDAPAQARHASVGTDVVVAFAPNRWPLPVGEILSLSIALCPAGALTAVDADMPAHRHGMNYRPSVRALGDGRWLAEGLLLHMPGRWRFVFDVVREGRRQRLTHELDVP